MWSRSVVEGAEAWSVDSEDLDATLSEKMDALTLGAGHPETTPESGSLT